MDGVLLGFDFGTHKIGVAVGQSLTGTATALETIGLVKHRPDWERITHLLAEWQPSALVVGHPFEMTDREANNAEGAKRFARQLHGRY
ncbi:MAG: Holliday junction resolvase RuvX, partial [Gammaproteobacteria bacterium]|nr:Holliday junction resolvase RuvX [Gammaproteobacteria bacterium]